MRAALALSDGKLRILMVAARYFPFMGGIETHIHEVGTRLAAAGHGLTVLTGNPGGELPAEEWTGGVRILRKRAFPASRDWCLAPGILAAVAGAEGAGSDVVHIQGYHTFSAPFGMLGSLRRAIPYVITFHSGGHSSAARRAVRGPQAAVLAPLAARAAQLVGVSDFEADHFSRSMGIPRERFVVVPNGAQLPSPAPDSVPDPEAPLVISLGRLERYKGHHRALEGFARLRVRRPNARLRLLGDGPYEGELCALACRLGIASVVEVGGIPASDRAGMATLLARASLVVLLSDYEAHPVAVMEALSLGRPVVVTDIAGCGELALRGLVRAVGLEASPEETATAMEQELARGPRRPLPLPDWDTCTARLLAIYQNALAAGRPAQVSPRLAGGEAGP